MSRFIFLHADACLCDTRNKNMSFSFSSVEFFLLAINISFILNAASDIHGSISFLVLLLLFSTQHTNLLRATDSGDRPS